MQRHIVDPDTPGYPCPRHPRRPLLHVDGVLPSRPGIAIVGTREADARWLSFTHELARAVAAQGIPIWSGGALGIDAAAHEGALAGGAPTVVVLGAGLDCPTPKTHRELFRRVIAAGGACVSPFDDAVQPVQHRFLERNGVLAASVTLLVVVACREVSGARNAAAQARFLGTPVGVVPHDPGDELGVGCHHELRAGAHVITSADDVFVLLGNHPAPEGDPLRPTAPHPWLAPPKKRSRDADVEQLALPAPPLDIVDPSTSRLSPFASRLLAGLDAPRHADELAIELGAPAAEVLAALVELRLERRVVACADGRFVRAAPR